MRSSEALRFYVQLCRDVHYPNEIHTIRTPKGDASLTQNLLLAIADELDKSAERLTLVNEMNQYRADALRKVLTYCLDSKKVIEELRGQTVVEPGKIIESSLEPPASEVSIGIAVGALDVLQLIGFEGWDDAAAALQGGGQN